MVIDVIVFTPPAPVSHIQGHSLHIYIMGNATVPWFGSIPLIGCQGTQKVMGGMMTWHNDGDGQHDDGDGRHDNGRHANGKGQQGDMGTTKATGGKTMAAGGTTTVKGGTTMTRCSRATGGTRRQ